MPPSFIRNSDHVSLSIDGIAIHSDTIQNLPSNVRYLYAKLDTCKKVSKGYQDDNWYKFFNEHGESGIYSKEHVDAVTKDENIGYIAKEGAPILIQNCDGVFLIKSRDE